METDKRYKIRIQGEFVTKASDVHGFLSKQHAIAASVGGGLGALNDMAGPIIEAREGLLVALLALLAGMVVCRFVPAVNRYITSDKHSEEIRAAVGKYWARPVMVFVAIVLLLSFISYNVSLANEDEGGYMAASLPAIAKLQVKWLEKIQGDTAAIRENTRAIVDNTARIADGQEEASRRLGSLVKQETSEDPRKELANRGQAWSNYTFLQAVYMADYDTIDLFLKGGMPVESTDMYGLPTIMGLIKNNPQKAVEVVDYLVKNAGLGIDQVYAIRRSGDERRVGEVYDQYSDKVQAEITRKQNAIYQRYEALRQKSDDKYDAEYNELKEKAMEAARAADRATVGKYQKRMAAVQKMSLEKQKALRAQEQKEGNDLIANRPPLPVFAEYQATPLIYAIWHGHYAMVEYLTKHGADVNRVVNVSPAYPELGTWTAPDEAGRMGQTRLAALLD